MPGSRYDAGTKAKAIRQVREHARAVGGDHRGLGAAGMSAETLRKWIRQAEVDEAKTPGFTNAESAEIRKLRRKNRELEQTQGSVRDRWTRRCTSPCRIAHGHRNPAGQLPSLQACRASAVP